jgi:hypothetical protein
MTPPDSLCGPVPKPPEVRTELHLTSCIKTLEVGRHDRPKSKIA